MSRMKMNLVEIPRNHGLSTPAKWPPSRDLGSHLRSPSSERFLPPDFWQAVYSERKGGPRGASGAEGDDGVCTAAGRWVRSVSTVRELDRASGPLVGPVPTRLCTHTQIHRYLHIHERAAASSMRVASLSRCTSVERAPSARARARARECACDTLPVSQCVRQERCIALRRCVKASENTRSLGSFARLSLFLSLSLSLLPPCSSGALPLARRAPSSRGSRSLFSVSVTPPKGPLSAFLPRASLHFDCIVATARDRRLLDEMENLSL